MIAALMVFARRVAWPLLVCALAIILALLGWGLATSGRLSRQEAALSRIGVDRELARAGQSTAEAATGAVADLGARDLQRADMERTNRDEIMSSPDAMAPAGAAGAAGLAGLCRRPAYRDRPRCLDLRGADTAPAAR